MLQARTYNTELKQDDAARFDVTLKWESVFLQTKWMTSLVFIIEFSPKPNLAAH